MKLRSSVIVFIIIFSFVSMNFSVFADDITIKSISPSEYYDSRPAIWGDYIVWRRAINQNGNEFIELNEPSWIMLYNIKSGNSWNITESNKIMKDNIYYHAEAPDIWDGKVIYESQINSNSTDTKLFMYNISTETTWEIPLKSSEYSNGHLHGIYGSWIVYTNVTNNKRQAYLYNYENGIYRTIIGVGDNYSVYGMVMNDEYVVLTTLNETDNFDIQFYNIASNSLDKFDYHRFYEENYTQIIATSIYEDDVAIGILKNETWSYTLYNINLNQRSGDDEDIFGLVVWGDNIAYQMSDGIHLRINEEDDIITSRHDLYVGDMYENTIVWVSNDNSASFNGDASDDYDIYVRTILTDEDMIINGGLVLIIILIAITVIVVVYNSKFKGMV